MSDKFYNRVKELFDSKLSRSNICNILYKEFPNLNKECTRSRVRRYEKSIGYNDILNTYNKDTDSISQNINIDCNGKQSIEYKADGTMIFEKIVSLSSKESLTPEKLLEAHGLDTKLFNIISCKSNLYQQQKSGGDIINLYQSKIVAAPKHLEITIDDIIDNFKTLQNTYKPRTANKPDEDARYMYEINISDLHLGKFACDFETGEELNSELATKRFWKIIDQECQNIERYNNKIEKILFVWSNDFFNSDGISNSTTSGTAQDTDTKWQKLFLDGINLLVRAIDQLSMYAPVKTFYIASNHSRQTDYYAICYLFAWFRNYENVEIDITPHTRHYERYGVNLIGFAHSYYEKKQNLPYLMSVEKPNDWSKSTYREFHLAHYHSEKVEEKAGIIFRWLPSVTGYDTWTTDSGYIGAIKRSYSFIYDKNKGLIQMNSVIVD
jgi:hypothetical protein